MLLENQCASIHGGFRQNHLLRLPNIPLPTRTMVAPSAIAASDRRHAHGQRIRSGARRWAPAAPQLEKAAARCRAGSPVGGMAIRPRNRRRGNSRYFRRQPGQVLRVDAGLALLTRDIHLQAHLQWRQVPGPLVAQAPGYSAAIHAVNPW